MKRNLVVGAGFSGATIANLIAENLNEEVLIIDNKDHIAGNCYDYRDENGIMIHKYGSHIFHTNSEKVWLFSKKFTEFNTYTHKVLGYIDGKYTHIPFNFNTLYDLFPVTEAKILEEKLLNNYKLNSKISIWELKKQKDKDLKLLADFIYNKIFLHYTTKQWGIPPNELASSITERVPVYLSRDNRYFQDKFQGIPIFGYTNFVKNMLAHKNIKIKLQTDYRSINDDSYDRIFYTGSIDEYFDYKYGILPYRSIYFELETYEGEYYQSNACINYPGNQAFTRIHEYKYYLSDKSDKSVIAKEYSENFEIGKNQRYYPIIKDENIILYKKYLNETKLLKNVYFLGRLGDYKYYDIDRAIERAFEVFEKISK